MILSLVVARLVYCRTIASFFVTIILPCFCFHLQTQWVVAAVRQVHRLAKGMFHSSYAHKDQQQIAELQKQYDLLRLTCATMSR